MVGMMKSCLESSPIPARDIQRTQTNLVHTRSQKHHRDRHDSTFNFLKVLIWFKVLTELCLFSVTRHSLNFPRNMMRALDKCVLLASRSRMHEKQTVTS